MCRDEHDQVIKWCVICWVQLCMITHIFIKKNVNKIHIIIFQLT